MAKEQKGLLVQDIIDLYKSTQYRQSKENEDMTIIDLEDQLKVYDAILSRHPDYIRTPTFLEQSQSDPDRNKEFDFEGEIEGWDNDFMYHTQELCYQTPKATVKKVLGKLKKEYPEVTFDDLTEMLEGIFGVDLYEEDFEDD